MIRLNRYANVPDIGLPVPKPSHTLQCFRYNNKASLFGYLRRLYRLSSRHLDSLLQLPYLLQEPLNLATLLLLLVLKLLVVGSLLLLAQGLPLRTEVAETLSRCGITTIDAVVLLDKSIVRGRR